MTYKATSHPKHIKSPPRVVKYSRSPQQVKRMNAWKLCSNYWLKNFTQELYNAWLSFSYPNENPYNAFLRLNIHRIYNDLAIDPTPPPE